MRIAFLGTGLMGGLMAERLFKKGFDLIVWNRTKSKTEKLKQLGIQISETASQAIKESDVVITMLSDFSAIDEVLFSSDQNFEEKTFIQMSTIGPEESILLKNKTEKFGGEYFEAPVLGGLSHIPKGKLLPMVGSTEEQYEKWKPFLEIFGTTVIHMGQVGKGAAAKLACNQLIASLVTSFAMSLAYVRESGIEVEKFMTILRPSNYYAPAFDKKMQNMLDRNFENTNFPLKHLLKDTKLILNEFEKKKINAAPLEAVKNILIEGVEQNLADLDYSSLYNIVHPT